MQIIQPKVEIVSAVDGQAILRHLELVGRTCYKSEGLITDTSAENFVRKLIARGHEAIIEHESISVRFICDRGVSHELVRHRLASYAQESTRYCNYSKAQFNGEITVIKPCFLVEGTGAYRQWEWTMHRAECAYFDLLDIGLSPQEARCVLPNSLKTEVVMTANLREWRTVLRLRCSKAAHPQMREVMLMLLEKLHAAIPVVFDDLYEEYMA